MTAAVLTPPMLGDNWWRLRPDTLAEEWSAGTWHAYPHHRLLGRAIVDCVMSPDGRLIVEMPPRYGKSEEVSLWTPTWLLQLNPRSKIMLASYEATLAQEWGGQVRDLLRDNGYPYGVEVASDTRAKDNWRTLQGGGMWTAGLGGAFTGRGGDLLIIDDPIKNWEEATSQRYRDRNWNWYLSTARTRLHPGGSIIIVQTRWHEDDLTGRIRAASDSGEGERFEVLSLPAVAEKDETHDLGPHGTWSRKQGEVLWADRFKPDAVEKTRKAVGPIVWGGLYQQHPSPAEGGILKRAWWRYYTALPDQLGRDGALISVDSSFKDLQDSDFVVMQCWWRFGSRKYLIDQVRERMDYPTFRKTMRAFALNHPECRLILVEDTANGPAVIADLAGHISGLVPRTPRGSKESRAYAVSGDLESGNVYLPDATIWPEQIDFVNECANFPNAVNDDQVDSFTQAMHEWPNVDLPMSGAYDPLKVLRRRR